MKQKVIIRFAIVGVLLLLTGAVAVSIVDKLLIEPRTVSSWGELVDRYLVSRTSLPPIPFMYDEVLTKISADDWSFLADHWQYKQGDGVYYVAENSKMAGLKLPLYIRVYEDLRRGELIVLSSADGENFQGEALFKAPEFMPYEKDFPLNIYASDELAPRRVVWEITLKAEAEAWSDLMFYRSQEVVSKLLEDGGMMLAMSVPEANTNDLWLCLETQTNSIYLNVFAPEGFTNRVEIYACTDLISSVWNIAVQDLYPSTNPAVWDASSELTNRFFRAGNMDIDTDSDGLPDARETIVYKTSSINADTDGDGMPDGWETQKGLNAKSASGVDGALGDPDGDGLKNLIEYEIGTEPFGVNQMQTLSPSSLTVEYRSLQVDLLKFGWEDFDANVPLQIYTKKTEQYEKHVNKVTSDPLYESTGESSTDISRTGLFTYNSINNISTNYSGTYSYAFNWTCGPGYGGVNENGTCQQDGTFAGTGYESTYIPDGPQGSRSYTFSDLAVSPPAVDIGISSTEMTSGFIPDPDGNGSSGGESNVVTLTEEYTTATLLDNAETILSSGEMPSWGAGKVYSASTTDWNSSSVENDALKDISAMETDASLRRVEYRFRFQGAAGVVYKIISYHLFMPEGGGSPQVVRTCDPAYILATGSEQVLERSEFVLNPPAGDGETRLVVSSVSMVTPSGDPINSPIDSGNGQNEFTYSTDAPGVLTMHLKAQVTPGGAAVQIKDQCYFTVDGIGTSTLAWDSSNPGGKPIANGDYLEATVTFTGLPANNADFGSKKAAIYYDNNKQDEKDYEVFFPKNAANHPGGTATDPNWFYYWQDGQVCGIDQQCIYESTADFGYTRPGVDGLTRLGPLACDLNDGPYTFSDANGNSIVATGAGKGIQCIAETVQHERHHLEIYNTFGILIQQKPSNDLDGDAIPASAEGTYDGVSTDPSNADTYNVKSVFPTSNYDQYGDNELRCRILERNLIIQVFPNRDWANPGSQTKNKWGP